MNNTNKNLWILTEERPKNSVLKTIFLYLNKYYPKFHIVRTVVLYGGTEEKILEIEIGFLLNEKGKIILGIKAPKLFQRAIENLLDYWK